MNYEPAIAHLKKSDPILAKLIDQVGPCRLAPIQPNEDLLFALSRTIIHQQLSIKAAGSIHRRFLQLYPDKSAPSAQDILDTTEDKLRGAGLSRPKINYLKDLAQKVLDGLPTLDELSSMDDESIMQVLTQVKGIGRWSVQMLLIFRLHRLDVMPTEDLGLRNAIQKLYGLDQLPDKLALEGFSNEWSPYCSIAAWYLWRSLDMNLWT